MTQATLPPTVATATAHARGDLALSGPLLAGWAPGRVNLIGEHTDYNDGFVLPIAVARTVALVGRLADDPADQVVRLFSAHHQATATFAASDPPTAADPRDVPLWARYIAGVVGELREAGLPARGFSAAIAGDVPLGGGMSSSAALVMAALTWLNAALAMRQAPLDLARLGQRAETRGSGVQVGILDHAASALGRPGQAVLIDCRSLAYEYIPFALRDMALLVGETGVARSLTAVGYNDRRRECAEATARFAALIRDEGDPRPIHALRDVDERDYQRLGGDLPQPLRRRARHIVTENARVQLAANALKLGEADVFTRLLLSSHASLRDDYEVSCPELDAVVRVATRGRPQAGARLLGAGFGGSALIGAPQDQADAIIADLQRDYAPPAGGPTRVHHLAPAGGPGTAPAGG
jgi:galactokinase